MWDTCTSHFGPKKFDRVGRGGQGRSKYCQIWASFLASEPSRGPQMGPGPRKLTQINQGQLGGPFGAFGKRVSWRDGENFRTGARPGVSGSFIKEWFGVHVRGHWPIWEPLDGFKAKFRPFWGRFWPSLTPHANSVKSLWSEMACTGVPQIVLHISYSTRTYWGHFRPCKVSFSALAERSSLLLRQCEFWKYCF